jgi:hypothetical protein
MTHAVFYLKDSDSNNFHGAALLFAKHARRAQWRCALSGSSLNPMTGSQDDKVSKVLSL